MRLLTGPMDGDGHVRMWSMFTPNENHYVHDLNTVEDWSPLTVRGGLFDRLQGERNNVVRCQPLQQCPA